MDEIDHDEPPMSMENNVKKFLCEITAFKTVEVTLNEDDLINGETDLAEAAGNMALDCAFYNSYPDMVKDTYGGWDATVEEVKEVPAPKAGG
jgi:hypothetical protein